MQTPLLRTKLFIPPPRSTYVPRPRLIQKLNNGLKAKLTLISAPAGFGKTTLISSWIYQVGEAGGASAEPERVHPSTVAWLALDERDNDPRQFWGYVVAALQTIDPKLGETIPPMLDTPQAPPLEALVTVLINDLAAFQPVDQERLPLLLVLEDYHLIAAETIHASLNFLLDHLPPTLHVLITTRSDPPLKLSHRQGRSEAAQIRASDLAFTREEVVEFLNTVMKLDLSVMDIAALDSRTEGWIAGLQMAALSLQDQDDKHMFVKDFAGNDRLIADYLLDEVLLHQPAQIQAFLLQTSILDQLCAPLCDAVTGQHQSRDILAQLERANLFLTPLDNRREWYRYHQLFTDLLRQRLRESTKIAAIAQLHLQASTWYEGRGEVIEAVGHALLAGDHQRVADLIVERAQAVFSQFKLNTLTQWIQSLPADLVAARPKLNMINAWALLATGQFEEVEQNLQSIEANVMASAETITTDAWQKLGSDVRAALIEVIVLRAVIAINQFDIPRTLELCQQVLPYLEDNSQRLLFNEPLSLRTVIVFNLGLSYELSGEGDSAAEYLTEAVKLSREQENINILPAAMAHLAQMQMIQGQLHQSEKTYRQALQLATEFTDWPSPLAGMAEIGLGFLYYEWNDLERAFQHFNAGIEMAKRWNHAESLMAGNTGLAQYVQARGDGAGALDLLQKLTDTLRGLKATVFLPAVEARRARLWIAHDNLAQAVTWLQSSNLRLDGDLTYLQEYESITLARLLITQKRWGEAETYIARLRQFAEKGERWERVIEILILQALVFAGQNNADQAYASLTQALTLAEPEGYVRLFVDEGPPMAQLLIKAAAKSQNSPYIHQLLQAFEAREPVVERHTVKVSESSSRLVEPLSERELEILQALADGLSNRELSQRLSISLSTVKTHTRNIYGKLGVNSRTQAVAQARTWGILPSS